MYSEIWSALLLSLNCTSGASSTSASTNCRAEQSSQTPNSLRTMLKPGQQSVKFAWAQIHSCFTLARFGSIWTASTAMPGLLCPLCANLSAYVQTLEYLVRGRRMILHLLPGGLGTSSLL